MARSTWLCKNSAKSMLLKIVHPGGHVELHDTPVLAAEIMLRNPKCCVAYPHVFQQPWAIVAPNTTLMLGQKFYLVPINTVRKLQRLSLKYSPSTSPSGSPFPSPVYDFKTKRTPTNEGAEQEPVSTCWFFLNKGKYTCLKKSDDLRERPDDGSKSGARKRVERDSEGEDCFSKDNCFNCLITKMTAKAGSGNPSDESRSMENSNYHGSSETKELRSGHAIRKRGRGSPKRRLSFEHWQPSLHSITEE